MGRELLESMNLANCKRCGELFDKRVRYVRCDKCRSIGRKSGVCKCGTRTSNGRKYCRDCCSVKNQTRILAKVEAATGKSTVELARILQLWTSGAFERTQLNSQLLLFIRQSEGA